MEEFLIMSPVLALAANVFAQIVSVRLTQRIGLSIVIGLCMGLIVAMMIGDTITVLTYLPLSFCFWAFLNLNITSLRIRLLRELLQTPQGLTTEEVLQYYSPHELIKRRIERLENSGQIKMCNGKWVLQSQKLLIFVWVSLFLRRLIIPKC